MNIVTKTAPFFSKSILFSSLPFRSRVVSGRDKEMGHSADDFNGTSANWLRASVLRANNGPGG